MAQTTQNTNIKFFLIKRSEIEARMDPHQFHVERRNAIEKLKLNNNLIKLKHLVKNVKTTTSEITKSDVYVGLENIESDTGHYIPTSEKESISSAGKFKRGHILFPKLRPYLNKVYLAEFDGICSTEFHIFDSEKYSNEFLTIYLRSSLIVNQTKHLMTGNTLPRLQTEDINNLPVPEITIENQIKIVELYNIANRRKQSKDAQAKELLKTIDTYLLNELGVLLPVENNTSLSRMFYANFNEITNGRLDPDYQNISYKNIVAEIKKSHFEIVDLKDVTDILNSGKTPAKAEYSEEQTQFPIIKVGSYTNDFIDLEKVDYVFSKQNLKAQKGDIFILSAAHQSEYVGRHIKMLIEEPKIDTSYVGELICVRANDKVNTTYLFSLLKTEMFKSLINREKTGQTSHVYGKDLKKIPIPLPDEQTQKRISDYIESLQEQVKLLKSDSKRILEDAKQEVEKIIIG
ncbi:restriction endonuclease subunit S [Sediminicola arcticus]|uniref:Restriction endonuclease subunit S n=1 Tax=Sediminicola arcticus TaxID=1574308 RepID=A0ABV2SWA6_9FLAO